MKWYYAKNGEQLGPVDDTEFRQLARSGEIKPDDLVWNETLGDQWQPASSFSFLFFHPVDLPPPEIPSESELASAQTGEGLTPNRYLMGRARASLKGKWGLAVLATLIYLVITFGINSLGDRAHLSIPIDHLGGISRRYLGNHPLAPVPVGGMILSMTFSGALIVGFKLFFLNLINDSTTSLGDLFTGFRIFWKSLAAYLLILFIILLWIILGFVIGGALVWSVGYCGLHLANKLHITSSISPLIPKLIIGMSVLSFITPAYILATKAMLSYSMTYFILADKPTTQVLLALRTSKQMMRGKCWKLFCLYLRFLCWSLLAVLTCGIGFLWVLPYQQTAMAHFYLDVKDRAKIA